MGFFGVKFLVQEFFLVLLETLGILWVLIFVPIRSLLSLEIRGSAQYSRIGRTKVMYKIENAF